MKLSSTYMFIGIEIAPLITKAQSPNHWAAREFLSQSF